MRNGRNSGDFRPRTIAMPNAMTRMNTSQTQNSFTLSQKPRRTLGKAALNSGTEKNCSLTAGQPGAEVIAQMTSTKNTIVLSEAMLASRRPRRERYDCRSGSTYGSTRWSGTDAASLTRR